MSSRSVTWRRLGVSAVALATVAAGSPLLLSSAASAAAPTRLTITQDNGRATAAAGTCTAFTVSATDAFGGSADAATITVSIAEAPNAANHDVDFCEVDGGTAFRTNGAAPGAAAGTTTTGAPQYTNAGTQQTINNVPSGDPSPGTTQTYTAGPSITGGQSTSSGGNPDNPSNATPINFPAPAPGAESTAQTNNSNNPSGVDRASFSSVDGRIRFGVVGLLPGSAATIDAFVDPNGDLTRTNGTTATADDDNVTAPQRTVRFTDGGLPNSIDVNNAARTVVLTPESTLEAKPDAATPATHRFTVQVFNGSGDVLGGVNQIRLVATSGPNAPSSTSGGTFSSTCGATGNEGEPASCTYEAQQAGTDTVTAFVNQTTGSPTFELDSTEPRDTATATTTAPSVSSAEARRLVLTPEQATIVAGQGQQFVATVTDINGAPAREVQVTFLENGPGTFTGGTAGSGASSTRVVATDGVGRALVTFTTAAGESGANAVFATITSPTTRCGEAASGTTPAGQCTDSSPVTITAAASPSATPTATMTPSASPSSSPSPSASPSLSSSPRPSSSPSPSCSIPARITLDRSTIIATGAAQITVRGTPNSTVEVQAYSRPSTTYRVVRTFTLDSSGTASDSIKPPTNTRLFAQQQGCNASESIVLNVRTQISLNVVRNGVRNYTFSGRLLPARPNGLIASLYRVTSDGRQILAAQQRANAAPGQAGYDSSRPPGSYSIRRQFTGSGRFGFVVRTGQDLQNAPGSSNLRSLAVF